MHTIGFHCHSHECVLGEMWIESEALNQADRELSSRPDPNRVNSFLNFRAADIQACYELWRSRAAEFTEQIPKYGETRCYIRDPDGYIIDVGQSTDLEYG